MLDRTYQQNIALFKVFFFGLFCEEVKGTEVAKGILFSWKMWCLIRFFNKRTFSLARPTLCTGYPMSTDNCYNNDNSWGKVILEHLFHLGTVSSITSGPSWRIHDLYSHMIERENLCYKAHILIKLLFKNCLLWTANTHRRIKTWLHRHNHEKSY